MKKTLLNGLLVGLLLSFINFLWSIWRFRAFALDVRIAFIFESFLLGGFIIFLSVCVAFIYGQNKMKSSNKVPTTEDTRIVTIGIAIVTSIFLLVGWAMKEFFN